MNSLSLLNNIFEEAYNDYFDRKKVHIPRTNIKETKENFVLEIELAGYSKEHIKIESKEGYLSVHALKPQTDNEQYILKEYNNLEFKRSFKLPANVNHDEIKAEYNNGILVITLSKCENKTCKLIQIE